MKYKRLLVALPFILTFLILSGVVEVNVISEYSIVIIVNRLLLPILGLACALIMLPKFKTKWCLSIVILFCVNMSRLIIETDLGRSCYSSGSEVHTSYYLSILLMILFAVRFIGLSTFQELKSEKVTLKT